MSMYDALDEVLQVGSEPFAGPISWRMVLAAIVGGALALLMLGGGWSFVCGAVIGLLVTVPHRGVTLPVRAWLLVHWCVRERSVVDLGTVDANVSGRYVVRTRRDGRLQTILRRGDS